MVHAELTIINEQGIHLGPQGTRIANLADRYDCQIHCETRIYGCECQKYY